VNSPTVLTTSGEILLPGAGGGIVIIDAWSHQPLCMITDSGDVKVIAIHVTMSPSAHVVSADGGFEMHEARTPDFPVRYEAVWSKDKHGNIRSKFVPRQV
jgi:hypothetical protein